jgi:hypothetical protein
MRRSTALALALAATLGAGACGKEDSSTPVACLQGSDVYLQALTAAPDEVRLDGETPIGDCLAENQGGGELASVGQAMVETATRLNAEARADPGGPPTVQLGYLIGAVSRGSEETQGIHAELVRRLESAALFSPAGKPPPPPFDQTYEKGYAAGRDDG